MGETLLAGIHVVPRESAARSGDIFLQPLAEWGVQSGAVRMRRKASVLDQVPIGAESYVLHVEILVLCVIVSVHLALNLFGKFNLCF